MDFNAAQNPTFGHAFAEHETTALDYSSAEEPPYLVPLLCDPTDWTLSTARPWQQSPVTESSVSLSTSGGVYPDPSWNPFDQSFATSQTSPRFEVKTEFAYGAQSCGSDENDEFINFATFEEGTRYEYAKSQVKAETLPAEPHHIFYREPSRQCKNVAKSKSKPKSKRSPKCTSQVSASKPVLPYPTVSSAHSSPPHLCSPPTSPVSSTNNNKTKTSRNKVEKQYRNRLNDEFQSLLQALPQDSMRAEWKKSAGARVSKAEVLVLARERIGELEEEGWCLEREKQMLLEKMEQMRKLDQTYRLQ